MGATEAQPDGVSLQARHACPGAAGSDDQMARPKVPNMPADILVLGVETGPSS